MNILDIIICVPLAWGIYTGFRKGVVFEIALLTAFAGGIWGGFRFSHLAGEYLQKTFQIQNQLLYPLSFLIVFAGIIILILLLAKFLESMIKITGLGIVNRLLGAVFGMFKWLLAISVVFYLLQSFEYGKLFVTDEIKNKSLFYFPVEKAVSFIIPEINKVHPVFPENKK